jgi:hypothetical protein
MSISILQPKNMNISFCHQDNIPEKTLIMNNSLNSLPKNPKNCKPLILLTKEMFLTADQINHNTKNKMQNNQDKLQNSPNTNKTKEKKNYQNIENVKMI